MPDVDISVGHGVRPDGRFDPGARGTDGRYEHYEVTQVVVEAVAALERCGVSVTHEAHGSGGPEDPNFSGSINRVNASNPTCCVEVHFDWYKGNPDPVGLHAGSTNGTRLSDAIRDGFTAEGFSNARSVQDTKYGRRVPLAFVQRTNPPACLVECGIVADHDQATNIRQGEAIARGIVAYLGRTWVPRNQPTEPDGPPPPDYRVAVIWEGDADFGLAYLLGKKHAFKVLHRNDLATYSVGYAVAVGKGAQAVVDHVGDGIVVAGPGRAATADLVFAKLMDTAPDRTRPWA